MGTEPKQEEGQIWRRNRNRKRDRYGDGTKTGRGTDMETEPKQECEEMWGRKENRIEKAKKSQEIDAMSRRSQNRKTERCGDGIETGRPSHMGTERKQEEEQEGQEVI